MHRKLLDHEIGRDPLAVALWFRLIAEASYEDKEVLWNGGAIQIKRGQFITSILKLSQWLRVSEGRTKRYLNAYQNVGQIEIKTTNKYTVITIRNYNKYQVNGEQNENRMRTNREQNETTNKDKETKEYKEGDINLTKFQLEKLRKEFPRVEVERSLEEFKLWQQSTGKTFKNTLARFKLWLMDEKKLKALPIPKFTPNLPKEEEQISPEKYQEFLEKKKALFHR
jgi:DNA replication protein DnaD